MKTITDLGVEFKALRKQAGLTQQEAARRAGTRQEVLSRFERGRTSDFSVSKLLRLAQTLECDLYFAAADRRPTLDDVLAERRAQLGGASIPTDLSTKDAPSPRRKR